MNKNLNMLLISNSTSPPGGYLDHCENEIKSVLDNTNRSNMFPVNIAFVSYARPGGISNDDYAENVRTKFKELGYNIIGVHEGDSKKIIESSEAIFIGGGNTLASPNYKGLGLVPFNFKPHYLDPDKSLGRESDETRIKEYHAHAGKNGIGGNVTVIGLREGAMLRVIGDNAKLLGKNGARVFRHSKEPVEYSVGDNLSFLLF